MASKELMPLNCGAGEDSWESLELQEIKPVNLKGNQPWTFLGRTNADAEAPIFWSPDVKSPLIGKDPDAGKDWGQKKRVSEDEMTGCYNQCNPEDEMTGCHDQCNGHELGQTLGDAKGQGGLLCCSPWGHEESDMTGRSNNHRDVKTVSRCKKRS